MKNRYAGLTLALLLVSAQQTMGMYNPQTGRFLSRDPRGELGFQAMQRASGIVLPNTGAILNRQSLASQRTNKGRIFQRRQEVSGDVAVWKYLEPKVDSKKIASLNISRNKDTNEAGISRLYVFCSNNLIGRIDPFGLYDNPCGGDSDKCMTCMAWGEARGAGNSCMKAVAQVIWNRSQDKNKSCCDIVSASGQFNAYNSSKNKGYEQCCKNCIPAGEKAAYDKFMNDADGWPEEFGGGDPQLDDATFFHSGASWPSSWGNQSDYEEVPVDGCSGMHFYKKL